MTGVQTCALPIFSKNFEVKVVSGGKKYTQKWQDNMSKMTEPEIKDFKGASGVEVTFRPDPSKFGGSHLEAFRTIMSKIGVSQPEEVATCVAYVASDDARWLTGERLTASGGLR